MLTLRRLHACLFAGALLALAVPARAAEADPYLPDDTEAVLAVNVRQILDSPLVKKFALEKIKEALKESDEVQKVLEELGFDPLKDLENITNAMGSDPEMPLLIVHGRFNLAKFHARGEEAAKDNGDVLKIHKVGDGDKQIVYEVTIPDIGQTVFVALPSKTTLVVSPAKEHVVDALAKGAGKKKTMLKSKELQDLLAKVDAKQSLWAVVGSSLAKNTFGLGGAREALEQITTVTGGATVADGVKAEFTIATKSADAAEQIAKTIKDLIAREVPPPLYTLLPLQVTAKEKTVTLKGELAGAAIEKAIKAIP